MPIAVKHHLLDAARNASGKRLLCEGCLELGELFHGDITSHNGHMRKMLATRVYFFKKMYASSDPLIIKHPSVANHAWAMLSGELAMTGKPNSEDVNLGKVWYSKVVGCEFDVGVHGEWAWVLCSVMLVFLWLLVRSPEVFDRDICKVSLQVIFLGRQEGHPAHHACQNVFDVNFNQHCLLMKCWVPSTLHESCWVPTSFCVS